MKTHITAELEFFSTQPLTKALLNELKAQSFSALQRTLIRIYMFLGSSRDGMSEFLKYFHAREDIMEEILEFAFYGKLNIAGTNVKRIEFSSLDELNLKLAVMGF